MVFDLQTATNFVGICNVKHPLCLKKIGKNSIRVRSALQIQNWEEKGGR